MDEILKLLKENNEMLENNPELKDKIMPCRMKNLTVRIILILNEYGKEI